MTLHGAVVLLAALEGELSSIQLARPIKVGATAPPRRSGEVAGHGVYLLASGSGAAAARRAIDWVLPQRPRAVIGLGYCGALAPELAPGDLVLATTLQLEGSAGEPRDAGSPDSGCFRAASASGLARPGALVTSAAVLTAPAAKRALGAASGALAVDLESYWLARAAGAAGIPWLVLRSVVDPVDWSLPPFTMTPGRTARDWLRPALSHALTQRGGAVELIRLGWAARRAAQTLGAAVDAMLPNIIRALAEPA